MAFIVKKKIHSRGYYYLNENRRVDGKVKTKTLAYLGKSKKEAERKAKEILDKRSKLVKKEIKKDFLDKKEVVELSGIKKPTEISIEELAAFCKRKGFVSGQVKFTGDLPDSGTLGL